MRAGGSDRGLAGPGGAGAGAESATLRHNRYPLAMGPDCAAVSAADFKTRADILQSGGPSEGCTAENVLLMNELLR